MMIVILIVLNVEKKLGGCDFVGTRELISKMKSLVVCSECGLNNYKNNNYCIHCGHKLKKISVNDKAYKIFCVHCGNQLKDGEKFCGKCGKKVCNKEKVKVCPVCGEWCGEEKYCWNCGHDNHKFIGILGILCNKKCPNCNAKFESCYSYCNECGTKLIKK